MTARIVVVDDHPVFRYGLVSLVETDGHYKVIGQAGSMKEGLELMAKEVPDLLLADLSLGNGGSGLDLLANVRSRFPSVRTLVVSIHNEAVYAQRVMEAGGWGYVMKQAPGSVLKAAIRTVLAGKRFFAEKPAEHRKPLGESSNRFAPLSPREREVLQLLGKGRGVNEIAEILGLSPKTVGVHQDHLKLRLEVATNYELRRLAVEWVSAHEDIQS